MQQSRRLPWDVLLVVFEGCDDATLAVLGRVSLDFLQSMAKIIYQHVKVDSPRTLELLFCERNSLKKTRSQSAITSRINPFLSLTQTKTLRVDFSSIVDINLAGLSLSRITQSDPLPLDLLRISYCRERDLPNDILSDLHVALLPHLDPVRLEYLDHSEKKDTPYQPLYSSPLLENWRRLEVIDLQGIIPYRSERVEAWCLAALPPPTLARRRTLRFHLATLLTTLFPSPSVLLSRIVNTYAASSIFGLDAMQEGSVVLVVRSKQEEEEVKRVVQTLEERWRPLFMVKLEV